MRSQLKAAGSSLRGFAKPGRAAASGQRVVAIRVVAAAALVLLCLWPLFWRWVLRGAPAPGWAVHRRRTVWVFSHIPKTGGTSVGGLISEAVGENVTCHTGQLLAWIRQHHRQATSPKRSQAAEEPQPVKKSSADLDFLLDVSARRDANAMLVDWILGKYDPLISAMDADQRRPLRHLPPVPTFEETRFIWAQHQDASMLDLVRCLQPSVTVRGVTWLRDPVERFYSSFYYSKYKYSPKMALMRNISLDEYIQAKFRTRGIAHVRRTNIYINWMAGVSGMFNTFEFPAKLGDQLPTRCLDEIQNRDSLASASILPRTRYDRLEARAQKWLHRPDTWHEEPNKIDDSSFVGVLECTAASFRQLLRVMGFAQVQENLGDADVQGKVANQNNLASLNIDEGDERTESIDHLLRVTMLRNGDLDIYNAAKEGVCHR